MTGSSSILYYNINVELLEDLHSGSGMGGSGIDALLARDRHGQPTIRWSHLKGLLRDALWERQTALGQKLEDTQHLADRLFGPEDNGKHALIRGTSLRLVGTEADTLIISSTAREIGNRVPREDTLRRIEFVAAGAKFTSCIRVLQIPEDSANQGFNTADWLNRLLLRLDRLGANRTRGSGRIRIDYERVGSTSESASVFGQAKTCHVLFEALDPLCIAATDQPGNIISSESYLPAKSLHGAMVNWAIESGWPGLANQFLGYEACVSAAYPVPSNLTDVVIGQLRAVPIALGLQSPKPLGQVGDVPWWATDVSALALFDTLANTPEEKLKRPSPHAYLYSKDSGKSWFQFNQSLSERLRNNAGSVLRKNSEQSLFSVEEIPEATKFVCTVTLPVGCPQAAYDRLKSGDWLAIGRGGAPLKVSELSERLGSTETAENEVTAFRILLTSDTIARDAHFNFHTKLTAQSLLDLIHTGFQALDQKPPAKLRIAEIQLKSVSEPCEIHGYNYATRLPRLGVIAIRRGSEVQLSGQAASVWWQALQTLQPCGLGERSFEGFGQYMLFKSANEAFQALTAGPDSSPRTPNKANGDEARRAKVAELLQKYKSLISMLEVGRWQDLRNRALDEAKIKEGLKTWFKQAERALRNREASAIKNIRNLQTVLTPDNISTKLIHDFALQAAKRRQSQNAAGGAK